MRFSVPIHGYGTPLAPHAGCFVDFVRAFVDALRQLGHEVVRPGDRWEPGHPYGRPIIFGAQNMLTVDCPQDPGSFAPADAILFNTEQTGARGADPKRIFDAVKTWRSRLSWDYSETNAAILRKMGCRTVYCPVGYIESMTRIDPLPPEKEDIDVMFSGSVESPQRLLGLAKAGIKALDRGRILSDLRRAGLKVEHVFGVYENDLDPFVRRAKVVLNLHYYEGAVFEIFRCSHLLANKKCVVTESGGCDPALEDFAKRSMVYTDRVGIVEECLRLVRDVDARRAQAERGFAEFKKTSLVENVRRALEQS